MSPPRVLHVLEALGGGTARHLIDVVRHTEGVAHHVAVPRRRVGWLSDDSAIDSLREGGAEVHVVEMRRQPLHPYNAMALGQLARLVRRQRPAVIHGHSSVGGALARLAGVGSGVPTVYTANGLSPGPAAGMLERLLAPRTTVFIAVSDSEGDAAVERRIIARSRLRVIPNGIDLALPGPPTRDLRAELGLASGVPLVGSLSRLVPQKAPVAFIRASVIAAADNPTAHFLLIGSGMLEAEVRAALAGIGSGSRVHWMPDFPEPATVLGQLDVLVSTSRFEGGPYAPLEAMRAGTPVVLTDVVGNRDVIEDGVSGVLVPADNPAATAAAITRLLRDRGLVDSMAEAGRRRLQLRFDVRSMGASLSALYLDLAAP